MNLKIDEEFRSLIPPLADEEREQLKQNIINDGAIREPIAVWHDFIIDGHNRYEISQETGISFNTFSMDSRLEDRNDVMIWMIENQKGRRNLPQQERVKLAYKLKPMYEERAKKNQQLSQGRGQKGLAELPNLNKVDTREKMAEVAGVSPRTMGKYQKLVESGNEELLHQYEEGDISLNAAYNKVMGIEEKPKPNKELEAANAKIAELEDMLKNNVVETPADPRLEAELAEEKQKRSEEKQKRIEAEQQIAWLKQNPPEPVDYKSIKRENEELKDQVATYKAHEEGFTLRQKTEIDEKYSQYKNNVADISDRAMKVLDLIGIVREFPKNLEIADFAECYIRHTVGAEARAKKEIENLIVDLQVIHDELDAYINKTRKLQVVK